MSKSAKTTASFEMLEAERARVVGALDLSSVSALLPVGSRAIRQGHASVIDLAGVVRSDSSGLALLIEWLSVARAAGQPLRYDNIPTQLHQIARLSDVDELLSLPPAAAPVSEPEAPEPAGTQPV